MRLKAVATSAVLTITVLISAVCSSAAFAAVELAPGAFVHHYPRSGLACNAGDVMVGVHINKRKATCARLNYGYRIANTYIDRVRGTAVPASDPYMHGCAADYVVQGLRRYGADEDLTCVSLENNIGQALVFSRAHVDGFGLGDDGTASTIYGLTNPKMHVCPANYAMAGIHQDDNDLYCRG